MNGGDEAGDLGEEAAGEEDGPEIFAFEIGGGVAGDAGEFGVGAEDVAVEGELGHHDGEVFIK